MASSMSLAYFPTDRRQTQILEICQQLGRDQGRCIAYAVERHWRCAAEFGRYRGIAVRTARRSAARPTRKRLARRVRPKVVGFSKPG